MHPAAVTPQTIRCTTRRRSEQADEWFDTPCEHLPVVLGVKLTHRERQLVGWILSQMEYHDLMNPWIPMPWVVKCGYLKGTWHSLYRKGVLQKRALPGSEIIRYRFHQPMLLKVRPGLRLY